MIYWLMGRKRTVTMNSKHIVQWLRTKSHGCEFKKKMKLCNSTSLSCQMVLQEAGSKQINK